MLAALPHLPNSTGNMPGLQAKLVEFGKGDLGEEAPTASVHLQLLPEQLMSHLELSIVLPGCHGCMAFSENLAPDPHIQRTFKAHDSADES